MKNANEVARYIRPMVLWSVVRSRFDSREPFSTTRAGLGRLTMGAGAIVTAGSLDGALRSSSAGQDRRADSSPACTGPRSRGAASDAGR